VANAASALKNLGQKANKVPPAPSKSAALSQLGKNSPTPKIILPAKNNEPAIARSENKNFDKACKKVVPVA